MALTLGDVLDKFVYPTLQDGDAKVRWTRDDLTAFFNNAVRDLVSRAPEAGVVVDTNLHLVAGAHQTLPSTVARLREIVCNETRVIPTPQLLSASVSSDGESLVLTFNTGIEP